MTDTRTTLLPLLSLVLLVAGCDDSAVAEPRLPETRTRVAAALRRTTLGTVSPDRVAEPLALPAPPPAAVTAEERELYERQCGACHGDTGRGDGVLASSLHPAPRDFGHGAFKLGSTMSGMPADDDLARVLERGMPGSAMPASAHLSADESASLVRVVRRLAYEGKVADLLADDAELTPEEAGEIAADLQAPGPVFEIPPRSTTPLEAAPDRVFAFYCTECHAEDGTAQGAVEDHLADYAGRPIRARNLTREPLKGGGTHEDVLRRIYLGMPGTPMPATAARTENLYALADHVLSLRTSAPELAPADARIRVSTSEADAPASLRLYPLRADGHDALSLDVRVVRTDAGLTVRLAWDAVDTDASAGALVRVSAGPPNAFAWNGEEISAVWTADGDTPAGAQPALVGDRFHVDTHVAYSGSSVDWIAVTIWERTAGGSPGRVAFTTWHAVDAHASD